MKRKRITIIAGITAVLFLLCAVIVIKKVDHSLTHHGARLTGINASTLLWITSRDAVVLRGYTPPQKEQTRYRNQNVSSNDPVTAQRVTIGSGASQPFTGFNSFAVKNTPVNAEEWSISPDRKKLIFLCQTEASDSRVGVCSLENPEADPYLVSRSRPSRWLRENSLLTWLPDSDRFTILENDSDPVVDLISCKMPWTEPTRISILDASPLSSVCTADNRIVTLEPIEDTSQWFQLSYTPVYPSEHASTHQTVPVPAVGTMLSARLSPDSHHILWSIASIQQSRFYNMLRKFSARWAAKFAPRQVITLYVTDDHGENIQNLGSENAESPGTNSAIANTAWLPDGKSISFGYQNQTYILPVLN